MDDWKTKKWRIFVEVYQVREYYVEEGVTLWRTRDLDPFSCYYLGQYPWYWDFNYYCARGPVGGTPVPPQTDAVKKILTSPGFAPARTFEYSPKTQQFGVWVGGGRWVEKRNIQPFGMSPFYPGVEWDAYKNQPEEDLRWYLGDTVVNTLNEQQALIKYINDRLNKCLALNYPKEIKQRTIQTPEGPAEWPGVPMYELELPVPSPPLGIALGPQEVKHYLYVWFGMIQPIPGGSEGLQCRIMIW